MLDASVEPGPHGTEPARRRIRDHLRLGCVVLDKPAGPASHQVAAWLRDALGLARAGHGGTLDPNVTGVLPVALDDATRAIQVALEADKEYVGVLRVHGQVPEDELQRVLREFTGVIWQMPPLKSAVARRLRQRRVHRLEVLERDGPDTLFRVTTESGTYIRKLCHDIGTVLGTGANMRALRRTRTGGFTEADCVTLQDVRDAHAYWREDGDETELRRVVRPIEDLLHILPSITVRDSAVDALCHGAPLARAGVVAVDADLKKGGFVAVHTLKGEAVGVAEASTDAATVERSEEGVVARMARVLMKPATYPRGWKRRGEEVGV